MVYTKEDLAFYAQKHQSNIKLQESFQILLTEGLSLLSVPFG
jgi:hypothetical protein